MVASHYKCETMRLSTSSVSITLLTAVSMGLGIVTQMVLARWLGAGTDLDAYYAASSLPNLFTLILTSSFNIIFVPIFLAYKEKESDRNAWEVASSFVNFLFISLGIIVLMGILLAPIVLRLLTPGYEVGSISYNLTLTMFRIQWPIILFSGINGVLSGIFYAHGRFLRPASAPVVNSTAVLVFTLAFRSQIGIIATAIGSLVGPLLMMIWLLPFLLHNKNYKLAINWRHPGLHRIRRLSLPWIASNSFAKGTTVIDTILASFLFLGSLTYINYAYRLITMSVNLVSRGTALSIFPRISQSYAQSSPNEFRLYFSTGIRFISLVAIPVTGLLMVLNRPFIRLLFERNNFTAEDTTATSWAVTVYAGAFVALSLGTIVSNAFYAQQNTKTPAIISVVSIFFQAGLAYLLIPRFSYLALAISFTIFANFKMVAMMILLRRQQPLDGLAIMKSLAKMSLATIIMALSALFLWHILSPIANTISLTFICLGVTYMLAAAIYAFILFLLRSPELNIVLLRVKETVPWRGLYE